MCRYCLIFDEETVGQKIVCFCFKEERMQSNSLFLGEFTRKELGESIANGTIKGAIVPTGALEQHQDHVEDQHQQELTRQG